MLKYLVETVPAHELHHIAQFKDMNNNRVKDYIRNIDNETIKELVRDKILLKKPILVKSSEDENVNKVESLLNKEGSFK